MYPSICFIFTYVWTTTGQIWVGILITYYLYTVKFLGVHSPQDP